LGELISRFYTNVETGSDPPVSGQEGRQVVWLMNEVWKELG
jgi:hypothetical protein